MRREKQTPNVEFGNEFGDLNAAKIYEVAKTDNHKKQVDKQANSKKK